MFKTEYRILTNGKSFRIQHRSTIFWITFEWDYGCTDRGNYEYQTKKAAEEDILKIKYEHPDQQWRICE